ncbi:hypothetical protein GOV11_01005 [Candidatus Woesearchaeota archaeon]|nr:hypothetical protein [Candidatus Woesearchaeota archaeon]
MSEQGITVASTKEILLQRETPPPVKVPETKPPVEKPKVEAPAKVEPKPVAKAPKKSSDLAVVLIRGREVGIRHDVKRTLDSMLLRRKNVCRILKDTPVNRGFLNKVKDFTAFGPVSADTIKMLESKRPKHKDRGVFRMHPPKGGYGRKGIKVSYNNGGVLGKNPKMDDLIKRMLW